MRGGEGAGGGGSRLAAAAAGLFADGLRAGGFCALGAGGSVDALFGDVEPVGSALMMLTGGIEADEGKLNRDTDGTVEALGCDAMAAGAGDATAVVTTLPPGQLAAYCVTCASNAWSFRLVFTRLAYRKSLKAAQSAGVQPRVSSTCATNPNRSASSVRRGRSSPPP